MSAESESSQGAGAVQPGALGNPQQLAAAERWLWADELTSHLRHAVSNKLGSARNAAFFIRRSLTKSALPTDPRLPTFFTLIDDELRVAAEKLASRVIHDRERSGPPIRTPLRACIDSALALRPPPRRVAVSVQCDAELGLFLPAAELVVALLCLFDNACESMAQAGQLAIVTSASAEYIMLSVHDSGGGFSPESAEHAFTPFYTTKPEHLGLGLNLVQRVLKEYGGRVVIDPMTSGTSGASVSLVLPQALAAADPPPGSAP